MRKVLLCVVIITLLISGCSNIKAVGTDTPVVRVEVQASTESGGVINRSGPEDEEKAAAAQAGASQPAEESDEATAVSEAPGVKRPLATQTPYPTYTAYPTYTPPSATTAASDTPADTPTPTIVETDEGTTPQSTVEATATSDSPADTPTPTIIETDEETDEETTRESTTEATATSDTPADTPPPTATESEAEVPTETPGPPPTPVPAKQVPAGYSVDLERIPDTDPAPPLTILVSTIRIAQNGYYKVTGTVRNDGAEVYGGIGVIGTFYEEANQCTKREVTVRGRDGSEQTIIVEDCDYNWHGPVEVYAACQLLEPGAQCPFSLEIYPEEYVSYLLHPEGAPVQYRQPAPLALSGVNVYNNGLGYVCITGTATNANQFTVRDANISGTLMNASGQIVSVGSIIVPGQIAPGASVSFDVRVKYEPYSSYQLNAEATQS